jgi:hypothetical protein
LSGRTNPQPASCRRFRPLTCLVTMRLPRARSHLARGPLPALRIASVSRAIFRFGEDVSDVTSSSSAAARARLR